MQLTQHMRKSWTLTVECNKFFKPFLLDTMRHNHTVELCTVCFPNGWPIDYEYAFTSEYEAHESADCERKA